MIEGSVDLLSFNRASGWAADLANPKDKILVRLLQNGKEIASARADMSREDLLQLGDDGKMAFLMNFPSLENMENIAVYGENSQMAVKLHVIETRQIKRGYQSFDDQLGDSNSMAKLECIGLPERLDGMEVLDLGCNEGFFCIEAHKRGAKNVTGIDADADVIAKAKARCPDINYIQGSWWDIPDKKYDLILFLSALHYESNQKELMRKIAGHLKPGGLFILECGAIHFIDAEGWTAMQRGDGVYRYAPLRYIKNVLLADLCCKPYGRSIDQPGDEAPRYVLHACHKEKTVILLSGPTYSGKTILAEMLSRHDSVGLFLIDLWFNHIKYTNVPLPENNPIYARIKNNCDLKKIDLFLESLSAQEALLLAEAILVSLPLEKDCIILEGYALQRPEIRNTVIKKLRENKIRIWTMEPEKQDPL